MSATTETPLLTERFEQALARALEWHRTQVRKGKNTPYVAHLLGVASIVLEDGGSEDEAIAALFHDAIEDAPDAAEAERRRAEIQERFGDDVLRIVDACTDGDPAEKDDVPWRERKENYVAHLHRARADTRRVSCADKLYNARAILEDYRHHGEALWERFNGGREDILWYYRALAKAFTETGTGRLAGELERVVSELERLVAGG